jgi:aminoglycoside 6'-N-acetyltransferase I
MKIQKARKTDLKEIGTIFVEEYSKPPYNENWSGRNLNNYLKDYLKNSFIYLAKDGGKITGFIIFHEYVWEKGKRGSINEIAVSSKYQGRGYGRELIKFAEDFLRKRKVSRVCLMANRKAKAFEIYKRCGYAEDEMASMVKKV